MKTLSDFKKRLHIGCKLQGIRYGYMGNNDIDLGIREVGHIQSNSFAFKTDRNTLSWCEFPKAANCNIEEHSITIFQENKGLRLPILKYTFV